MKLLIISITFISMFVFTGCKEQEGIIEQESIEQTEIETNMEEENANTVFNGIELIETEKEEISDYTGSMTVQEQADLEHMIDKIETLTNEQE